MVLLMLSMLLWMLLLVVMRVGVRAGFLLRGAQMLRFKEKGQRAKNYGPTTKIMITKTTGPRK